MTNEKYLRASEIHSIQNCLNKLYIAIHMPHPRMLTKDNDTVSFSGLGERYEKELKDLIIKFIEEKDKELDKEFKEL